MLSRIVAPILLPLSFASVILACKKSDKPKPAALPKAATYTSAMGGARNWHRSHYYVAGGIDFPVPINEFYYLPDTSFAVGIINDSTIKFLTDTFLYEQTDSAKQIHFFGTGWTFFTYNSGRGVAYYYAKDSIVYGFGDVHGTSDYWTKKDICYTY